MFRFFLRLAWLTLWRRKIRLILVATMIGVSMAVMVSIQGLYDGMTVHMIKSTLRSDSGEISIYAKGYRVSESIRDSIAESGKMTDTLASMDEVKSVTSRIKATGLISTARKSLLCEMIGVDIASEKAFGEFDKFIVEGDLNGSDDGQAIIGKQLARDLGVKLGERIVYSTQNLSGDISSLSLRITAIIQTSNIAIDDRTLYVTKPRARELLGFAPAQSTQVAIRVREGRDLETLQKSLQERLNGVEVYRWQELYPSVEQMQVITDVFNAIGFGIIMLVVLIGIMGVMVVSVLERLREFGIQMAIGVDYRDLRLQLVGEALIMSLLGYLLGAVLGGVMLYYLYNTGMDLREFSSGLEEFGFNSIIYADVRVGYFTMTLGVIVAAALLSVIVPLRRLKKLRLLDVIESET